MVPQQIAGGDIYPALEKGTIDAAEWVGPYDDEKLGFHKVAQYYYYPGWWEGGPMLHNFINLEKWNELPKPTSRSSQPPRSMANTWMQAKYDAGNPAALKRLVAAARSCGRSRSRSMERRYKAAQRALRRDVEDQRRLQEECTTAARFRNDQYLWWQVAELYDTFWVRQGRGRANCDAGRAPRARFGLTPQFFGGSPKSSGGGKSGCWISMLDLGGSIPVPCRASRSPSPARRSR